MNLVPSLFSQPAHPASTYVWDRFVRLFHWSLAGLFLADYVLEDRWMRLHSWIGYALMLLIMMRIVWGFVGTRHARFRDFVISPGRAMTYLRQELSGKARRYLGHNPAGGLMILALLAGVLGTSLSGVILYGADDGAGPLGWLLAGAPEWFEEGFEEVHEIMANLTLLLVFVHVAGVLVGSLLHDENLILSMLNGYKRSRDPGVRSPSPPQSPQSPQSPRIG